MSRRWCMMDASINQITPCCLGDLQCWTLVDDRLEIWLTRSPMKNLLTFTTVAAAFAVSAFAEAPTPVTDMRKALNAAAKDQKMAFILMGRPTCGNCNATKKMIKEG